MNAESEEGVPSLPWMGGGAAAERLHGRAYWGANTSLKLVDEVVAILTDAYPRATPDFGPPFRLRWGGGGVFDYVDYIGLSADESGGVAGVIFVCWIARSYDFEKEFMSPDSVSREAPILYSEHSRGSSISTEPPGRYVVRVTADVIAQRRAAIRYLIDLGKDAYQDYVDRLEREMDRRERMERMERMENAPQHPD